MKVWVLDIVGYDARGGNAQVFSTPERAKAARPYVEVWIPDKDDGGWYEDVPGTSDMWSIYPREVDDLGGWMADS